MTSKWKKGKPQSSQELEDSMSQELADLGMLEQGMTFEDKEQLLKVIRMSQKSAQVEEQERKIKVGPPEHTSAHAHTDPPDDTVEGTGVDDISTSKQNENGKQHEGEIEDEDGDINQDILSNMVVSECDSSSLNNAKRGTFAPVKDFDYVRELGEVANGRSDESKTKQQIGNSPNSVITVSSKDSENGSMFGEQAGVQNGGENENGTAIEAAGSDDENSFLMMQSGKGKKSVSVTKEQRKDDRERNIDVFSFSNGAEHNFVRSCVNKNQERIPIYFVPEGMGIRKYIAYFKCCVNQYYNNLAGIQKNSIEHMEWGPPISMEVGFTSVRSQSEEGDSSRRYNFRDRYPKQKVVVYASENSEEGEEEESNDEEIFVPRSKRLPGIKLCTKRKNTSVNDMLSTKKERKEGLIGQRKLVSNGEILDDDMQAEQSFDMSNDFMERGHSRGGRGFVQSRKRARRSRQKSIQHSIESQDDMSDVLQLDPTTMASIIEPDIVIAEGPAPPELSMITCDDVRQPSPLTVKQRRLQLHSEGSSRQSRRKSEPRKNPDVVLLEDIEPLTEEPVKKVSCPICGNLYPDTDIQEHASECN